MRDLHTTTDMGFLLLVCLLSWPGTTSADAPGFVVVAEGDDAVLNCSLKPEENIEQMIFDWTKDGDSRKEVFYYVKGSHYNNERPGQDPQFKGRVSHFQDELRFGNASITIRNTELADNGSYTCVFPDKPNQRSTITLHVGAAPKPDVKPLNAREDYALLQCKVHGVPEPTVEWKDSDGNVLSAEKEVQQRDGCFYITLQVKVTKPDNYTCVATQEEIHHRISDTMSVHVSETPIGLIIGIVVPCVLLVLVVVGVIVLVQLFHKGYLTVKWNSKPSEISNLESAHLNSSSPSGQVPDPSP